MPHSARVLQGDATLPEICMDLHMAVTGSCDRPDEAMAEMATILMTALEDWEPGLDKYGAFDDAMKNLVTVTVQEYRRYRSERD